MPGPRARFAIGGCHEREVHGAHAPSGEPPVRLGIATVASKNYLAHVRTLCESVWEHQDWPVYVLVADDLDGLLEPERERFITIAWPDVLPPEFRAITFYYTPFELCCALRPFLHGYLMSRTDLDAWIFLDSDVLVTAPLGPVVERFTHHSILLSPHLTKPVASALKEPIETEFLKHGIFNGGFLGLRRSPVVSDFVDWFRDRLVTHCFAYARNAFVDQLWLNFVPSLFPDADIVRLEGLNVGFWNLSDRVIRRGPSGGPAYTANGQPLLFVHFSHWRYDRPDDLTNGWPVASQTESGILEALGRDYRDRLRRNGIEQCRDWPYSFARYDDGSRIPMPARRKYYDLVMRGEAPTKSPFTMGGELGRESRAKEWLRSLKRRGPRLNA